MDFFGPADAPNAVTVRPGDARSFPSADSWFRDCSTPAADDGTDIQAAWLNSLAAGLRALARANGGTVADPTVKIVPENGLDDNLLIKAIQHLIQRGQPTFALDTGAANALVVTLSPAPPELKDGMQIRVRVAHDVTGPSTINPNGFGNKPIVHGDGAPLAALDMRAGQSAVLEYYGGSFQLVGAPINVLTQNATYYVNSATGSDANNGLTSGAAFATVQHALDVVAKYNVNGFTVTIIVAGGTYTPIVSRPINGSGLIVIQGASSFIHSTSGSAITLRDAGYQITGVKVQADAAGAGDAGFGLRVQGNGSCSIANIDFGFCAGGHMVAEEGGGIGIGGFSPSDYINISGNAPAHLTANNSGTIILNAPTLNIIASVAMSTAFAYASGCSNINGSYSSITGAAPTGSKFLADLNAVINSNGAGPTSWPGTVAGTAQRGGQSV